MNDEVAALNVMSPPPRLLDMAWSAHDHNFVSATRSVASFISCLMLVSSFIFQPGTWGHQVTPLGYIVSISTNLEKIENEDLFVYVTQYA